jgi:hypothetical protein
LTESGSLDTVPVMAINDTHHPALWPPLWQRLAAAALSIVSIGVVLACLTMLFVTHPVMLLTCLLVAAGLFTLVAVFGPSQR